MLKNSTTVAIFATLAAFVPPDRPTRKGAPNLSGTYRCSPEPAQLLQPSLSRIAPLCGKEAARSQSNLTEGSL